MILTLALFVHLCYLGRPDGPVPGYGGVPCARGLSACGYFKLQNKHIPGRQKRQQQHERGQKQRRERKFLNHSSLLVN